MHIPSYNIWSIIITARESEHRFRAIVLSVIYVKLKNYRNNNYVFSDIYHGT
jgi:hypothetical protein